MVDSSIDQVGVISMGDFLVVSTIVFTIGVCGIFLNRKNIITLLMSIELMLIAVNLNFVVFSNMLGELSGQIFVMFILTTAAAEIAIGLAILIVYFRHAGEIEIGKLNILKG
ncbi:MAG: NADH-quinone oxidoreductase subunit NuoK [Rickettsiales bacterium]|nr:NADH-quinone oxidoreductase subunit NuoK [Rickettsiales bacterium]